MTRQELGHLAATRPRPWSCISPSAAARRPRAVAELTYSEHALPSNAGVLFVDQERDIAAAVSETTPRRRRIGSGPCSTMCRSAKTSRPSTRPNLSALESRSAPSARLRRNHHAATGPVLLPAPPGRERPTPLAARRRRHSFLPRRRGARLAFHSARAPSSGRRTNSAHARRYTICARRARSSRAADLWLVCKLLPHYSSPEAQRGDASAAVEAFVLRMFAADCLTPTPSVALKAELRETRFV